MNTWNINRRQFVCSAIALVSLPTLSGFGMAETTTQNWKSLPNQIQQIEKESGGRLGVAIIDMQTDTMAGYRTDERFPLCSTFKLLAASAILQRVDQGHEDLNRRVRYTAEEVVANSPTTKQHDGEEGMLLSDICEAAITLSDNTAGNQMLKSLNGPSGVTSFARSIGDRVTRLDRTETSLNEALTDDPRDTTSPGSMARDIRKLAFGDVLSEASKQQLIAWLRANKTSAKRFRAGVPSGWIVGDKTGSGDRGSTNDVGIFWPPDRSPIIVAVYLTNTTASPDECSNIIVKVARAVSAIAN